VVVAAHAALADEREQVLRIAWTPPPSLPPAGEKAGRRATRFIIGPGMKVDTRCVAEIKMRQ